MTVSNPFRQPLRRADVIAVLTKNDAAHAAYLDRLGQRDPELAERAARGLDEVTARVAGEETRRKRDRRAAGPASGDPRGRFDDGRRQC